MTHLAQCLTHIGMSENAIDGRPSRDFCRRTEQFYLDDPDCSYWLKDAIRTLMSRDPVNARTDAAILWAIMEARLMDIQETEYVRSLS